MKRKLKLTWMLVVALLMGAQAQLPKGVTVTKIWDQAPHSAFTDLIWFDGAFYCSFREGEHHVFGEDGTVRVLKSADGKSWKSVADLAVPGFDLRDPKLSITPDNRLMVIIGGSIYEGKTQKGRKPHVSFSADGENFSTPEQVTMDADLAYWGNWIWRVTWHEGVGYAVDYQIGPDERKGPTRIFVVKTTDGKHFSKVSALDVDGFPNESTVRFNSAGKMYVMVRRELDDQMGVMATSTAPFTDWTYEKMNYRLGGPNFIFGDKGVILATSRVHGAEVHTGLLANKGSGATFHEILSLPSGGDNSYAGMVLKGKYLWLSYYSAHEGKSAIYLAKVPRKFIRKQLRELAD
ncbi:hypothetical protein [Parapedobacter indicus]|uniref:BNR repeat-like domain-containing protein n=1 Tax=Parapedobacter indicus TaxID=1477437 RepID=A0A1I3TG79_9SPHI|nr:hypothetical protein [Parapedobacter indicus]PPK99489.1 hypothetical protein CLV26_1127 [Parapedobacter indicus]SFJ70184.1 hypothetical protein SAMN05444682_112174 [Parapedobacter indicus]